ncbi:MAG: hypothetical protein ACK4RK_09950 [Gemmataceae bacterium]
MAFNPFSAFRKHQKVMFAGLTILAMITFVFLGFAGDPLSQLLDRYRGRGGDMTAATLYGRDITARELSTLRAQREIANTYITSALAAAQQNMLRVVQQLAQSQQLDAALGKEIQDITGSRQFYFQFAGQNPGILEFYVQQLPEMRQRVGQVENRLRAEGKTAEAGTVALLNHVLAIDGELFAPRESNLFFGGTTTDEGLFDFLIWLHEADRLRIQLSPAQVQQEIKALTYNQFTQRDSLDIEQVIERQYRDAPTNILNFLEQALTDEFRVRLARIALEGYEPGARGEVPVQVTPYELWEFYRDQRTELELELFTIPVRDFLPQVTEKPTEAELRKLFTAYRRVEAHPASESPGFRQPKRYRIQWISARPDEERYQQAAKVEEALLQATLPLAYQMLLQREYQNLEFSYRMPSLLEPYVPRNVYDQLLERRKNAAVDVAATVGQLLGPAGWGEPTFLAATLSNQAGRFIDVNQEAAPILEPDRQRRAAALASLLFLDASPQSALGTAIVTTAADRLPQPAAYEAARAEARERIQSELAHGIVLQTLQRFVKNELEPIAAKENVKDVDMSNELAEAAQRYGLKTGVMDKPRGQFEIQDDPALKPLLDIFRGPNRLTPDLERQFAHELFNMSEAKPYVAEGLVEHNPRTPHVPAMRSGENFMEERFWASSSEPLVFWKTKVENPRDPLKLDEVYDQVVLAWKLSKARELAKKAAEALAAKVAAARGDEQKLRDLAVQEQRATFTLENVAALVRRQLAQPGANQPRYEPYAVSNEKVLYPGPGFVDSLLQLKEKDKNIGDTVVTHDQPIEHYYVAALISRVPPSERDFLLAYRTESSMPSNSDTILNRYLQQQTRKYREQFMAQLRQQASLKLNPEYTERRDSDDGRLID